MNKPEKAIRVRRVDCTENFYFIDNANEIKKNNFSFGDGIWMSLKDFEDFVREREGRAWEAARTGSWQFSYNKMQILDYVDDEWEWKYVSLDDYLKEQE